MGGKPKVQGGMTASEQRQLMQEERNYQREEELKRREAAIKAEEDRVKRDQEQRAAAKAAEEKRLRDIAEAETKAANEAAAKGSGLRSRGEGKTDEEESSVSGLTNRLFDFYSALYSGMRRPS